MFSRSIVRWPALTSLSARARRSTIGAVIAIPVLLAAALASFHPGARPDSGLAGCTSVLSTRHVTAARNAEIRAQFAGSRWPDLSLAGTAYADLITQLRRARGGTDGYEAVWFYERLSAACARHGRQLTST